MACFWVLYRESVEGEGGEVFEMCEVYLAADRVRRGRPATFAFLVCLLVLCGCVVLLCRVLCERESGVHGKEGRLFGAFR